MNPRGVLYVLAAACCWGAIGPVSRYAFAEGMAPLEVAFWRIAAAWILFALHAVTLRRVRVPRRDLGVLAGFGVWGVALMFGAYQYSVVAGGAALAAVLLYTAPVWVALMARAWLGEKFTVLKSVCTTVTLAGVVGVAFGAEATAGRFDPVAVGCGLVAAVAYAAYYVFGKRIQARHRTPTVFLYAYPAACLALLPFVRQAPPSPLAWASIVILAVVSTYGAYSLHFLGLRHLDASRAAVIACLEPVVAGVLAYLWWDERFSWLGWVGGAAVLAGVLPLSLRLGGASTRRSPAGSPR